MHRSDLSIPPVHDPPVEMADTFADLFTHNITLQMQLGKGAPAGWIRSGVAGRGSNIHCCLSAFTSVTETETRNLVMMSPSKSRGLDPLPTCLLKDNLDQCCRRCLKL